MTKPPHILDTESVEEFDALSATLQSEFKPANEVERALVEMMIQHEWFMRRAIRMQQQLTAAAPDESQIDPKRLKVVVRYYQSHERAYAQSKRQLESMRNHKRKMEKAAGHEERQWEQLLKKMPTLTNWVN